MSTWSDSLIATVGAKSANWKIPANHGSALRGAVDAVRAMLRQVDLRMSAVERDAGLTTKGKQERLADIARDAIARLDAFDPLRVAENETTKRLERLETKTRNLIATGDATFSAEIRAHVKNSGDSPAMTAMSMRKDKRAVAAILEAPCWLSGLTEQEAEALRVAAISAADPEAFKEINELNEALNICRDPVRSATGLISERGQIRKTVDGYVTPTGEKVEA